MSCRKTVKAANSPSFRHKRVSIMASKMIFLSVLFLAAGAVNAATTTISQSQNQAVDGENFTFDLNPGAYQAGSISSFTVSLQGNFGNASTQFASIILGDDDRGDFNRNSVAAYDVEVKGFNNLNAYRYKVDFDLDAAQTADFMDNSIVGIEFADGVVALCGWWNYGNCVGDNNVAPYAAVDFTYEVSNVPVPAAVWLFGSALIGLFGVARRRKA